MGFNTDQQADLFITTLGFEDRTHQIIDGFLKNDFSADCFLLLINYPTNKDDNNMNLPFFEIANERMAGYDNVYYQRESYTQELNNKLHAYLKKEKSHVIFDISTCSSYMFYPTMIELMKFDIDLTIGYSEAEVYFPNFEEWQKVEKEAEKEEKLFIESFENARFLSSGVQEVYAYSPFSELNPGNKTSLLVGLPNFSVKRMNAIVNFDREMNKTSYHNIRWLIGKPPSSNNEWRIDGVKKTNNLTNQPDSKIELLSTLYYKETIKTLENIWSETKYDYHITIGSLGSKMQHLGTFFFLAFHQDIGLILAEPKEFNANRFSSGSGDIWQLKIGNTTEISKLLDSYLTFKWEL